MKRHLNKLFVLILLFGCISFTVSAQLLDSLSLDTTTAVTSIDQAMKNPKKVIKLVLKRKHLKEFPAKIINMTNLQYLDLSKNHIKELPIWIDTLKNLQVLILSKNDIENLPPQIGNLKHLYFLNVNQNNLVALPPEIGKLSDLEYLDLWSNNIATFPDELKDLTKLRWMDLRVVLIGKKEQDRINGLLPHTHIYFSPSCQCRD